MTALLKQVPANVELCLVMDDRLVLSGGLPGCVKRVKPSIAARFAAEKWLHKEVGSDDTVLCFGNLPPLFGLRGRVIVFIQNRYLVDTGNLREFSIKTRLKIRLEKLWLAFCLKNVDEILVQSPSMQKLLGNTANGTPVNLMPFMVNANGYSRNSIPSIELEASEFDFLYVASGEPHKNHRKLISAWCQLASENLYPSLLLTLDQVECFDLCEWIKQKTEQHQLKITNMGNLHSDEVGQLYTRATALIYPSTLESFGIPLIEASQAGLAVVASELDFVRDVLDPVETFDPGSSISIARAVKRYLKLPEQALPLRDAASFLEHVLRNLK
ncbi:glycosyltransferase [Gammaproteobacteria bacterium]|nr:glycosyltransferase [Gammaproteobacteria bacterium]